MKRFIDVEGAGSTNTSARLFSALGAVLMIAIKDGLVEDIAGLYRASLRVIRPQLIGAIAEDADRVLAADGEGV